MAFAFFVKFSSSQYNSSPSTSLMIQLKPFRFYEIWGVLPMIAASDLRRSGGAPLKIPPIWGVQRFFRKITEKRPRWRSIILGPICPPVAISTRIYPQVLRTPKGWHLKNLRGAGDADIGLVGPFAYIFSYIGENRIATPLGVFSARFRGR